jgi:HAMP domain-containing protein
VIGGVLVTSLGGILPIAAEYARRNRAWALMMVCWLAVPLTLAFVFTAAIQRTGTVMDTDEAGRRQLAERISIARTEIGEAEAQLVVDKAAVKRNCDQWGPICTKAKDAQAATERKLADARGVLKTSGVEIDDSIRRLVAYLPFLTKEQVQLYYPMLLPMSLAILGSIFIAIGSRRRDRQTAAAAPPAAEIMFPMLTSPIGPEIAPATAPAMLATPGAADRTPVKKEQIATLVARITSAAMTRAKHQRVDIEDAFRHYTAVCKAEGREPVDPITFSGAISRLCRSRNIELMIDGDRAYLLGFQLTASAR